GLVSSDDRAQIIRDAGAVCAINRKSPELSSIFTSVPENADEANKWEQAGEPLLDAFKKQNGGKLADYAVSHAGETAFPRTFQLLDDGGVVAFYGASSGYHFTFMGKDGGSSPGEMLARCGLRGDQSVLVFYGPASDELNDSVGLEVLEEIRAFGARAVVTTTTDGQRDFVLSLGFEDAVAGVVSLETLKRRLGDAFDWPLCMPRLPDSKTDTEAFKRAVRDFQERTMKPFGGAVGKILRSPDNPRGAPDVVFERAAFDSLGVSSALVKPYTGCVVYSENLKGRRFSFYAPQVWTRQRRIVMPTAEIRGTHLCNAYEAAQMHDLVAAGVLSPTQPTVVPWDDLPKAHQSMWDNVHAGATYVVNHALPELGLKSRDELFEAWSSKTNHSTTE
ncbi:MAG: acetyl-CoA synthetase, partial [Pseudomonadota bacterium]